MALNASLESKRQKQKEASDRYLATHREEVNARARKKVWEYRRGIGDPEKIARWKEAQDRKKVLGKEWHKENYLKNREFFREKGLKRYLKIKADPVLWRKKLDDAMPRIAKWRKENPDKLRRAVRAWEKTEAGRLSVNASKVRARKRNPVIALKHVVRCRINQALRKGYKKLRSTRESLGCSIPELKAHLESLFRSGMTWENRGQWEIDHIRPCASFNLLDPEQQKCCFHYTNLQPLWREENRRKSDNIQWA